MEKIEVELPNGEIREFPGGTSDAEINASIEAYLATQGAAEPANVTRPTVPTVSPMGSQPTTDQEPMTNPFGFNFDDQKRAMEAVEQARLADIERQAQQRMMGNPETPFRRDVLFGQPPATAPITDRVLAGVSDVADFVTPGEDPPNRFQESRDKARIEMDRYIQQAKDVVTMIGTPIGGEASEELPLDPYSALLDNPAFEDETTTNGIMVAEMAVNDPDSADGYRIETIRLPNPESGMFSDIMTQALARNVGEYGDLFTEGAITQEGEFSQSIPRFQLSEGQQITSDIVSFIMPSLLIDKVVTKGGKLLRASNRATGTARFGSQAVGEAINSNEDDDTLIVAPERMREIFKGVGEERSEDMAMVADALIVNGAFNGILRGISFVGGGGVNKVRGIAAGLSGTARREMGERETVMRVLKFIDPKIDSFGEDQFVRNLQTFSTIIDNNKTIPVLFGQISENLPAPTVNALMRGASDYVRLAHVPVRNTMAPEQWDKYVNDEATLMVNRLIGMTRAEAVAGQAVAQRQAEVSDGVRSIMRRGAEAELPAGAADTRQAMGQATNSLVDVRRTDIGSADAAIAQGTEDLTSATARLSNVASDNEIIRGLLNGSTPPTEFFREGPFVERMKTLMGDELYTAYRTAFDNSDRAYASIPNTPISEEGITAFQSVLDDVVRDANQIDSSGRTARNILGRVYNAFQPQTATDAAGDVVVETTEELMDRLSDLGFQDMYRLKQQLSRVVDSQAQGPVRDRLIELRRHITDGDTGQIAILRQTGDSATATAAEAADQTFREAMARFSNSAPMKQFSDLAGTQRAVGGTYDTVAGAARRGEPDMIAQGVGNILPQITNDTTGAYFDNFALALDTVMSRGELDEVMSSRVTSEALYNLGIALQASDQQSADLIISSIRPHAAQLERANPGLLDTLERASGQVRQEAGLLTSQVDEAQAVLDQAKQAKTQAENSILRKFIDKESTNLEAISNPRGTLLNMMRGNNAGNEYKSLMSQIARIPDAGERAFAEQALRATTIENITEMLFTSTTGAMVEPLRASAGVSMSNIDRILNSNGNNILDVVDTVFAGSDPIKQHYRTVLAGLATDELPDSVKFRLYGSDTDSQLAIRDAASTGILLTLGYMNPTAAAARRLSAEFVNQAEADLKRVQKETLVNMLAYPEEFSRLTEVLMRSREPSVISQAVSDVTTAIGRGIRAEVRTNDETRDSAIDQTNQMLSR